MESGSFSRGREELVAEASIVFAGNINQPVEMLVRTSTLFQPLPEDMQDMALIDRLHFYLPGWEMPKMRNEFFTDHYGFVVDYLAEALRELRRQQLHRGVRPPLQPGQPPEHPRRQGRAPHRVGPGQAAAPGRRPDP